MLRRRPRARKTRKPAELAPFPGVALQVLERAGDPDLGPAELVELIRTDAAISARILRLANSSLYGFRQRVDTLEAAGVALGATKLIEVAIASTVSLYHASRGHLDARCSKLLWRRSVGTALAAQEDALERAIDPARAFFAGLFVPIGLLRLHQVYPQHVIRRARAYSSEGATWREAQRRVFGLDQLQEGSRLLRDWGLPAWIAASLEEARAPRPLDLVGETLREADHRACAMLLADGTLCSEDHWTVDMGPVVERLSRAAESEPERGLRAAATAFDLAA